MKMNLSKKEELMKFFILFDERAKIIFKEVDQFAKLEIYVPKRKFHFIRTYCLLNVPMGVMVDVKNLASHECRLPMRKIFLKYLGEEEWIS